MAEKETFLNKEKLAYLWSKIKLKLDEKQDTLKDGETIKTINGQSLLGEGNLDVGGSEDKFFEYAQSIPSQEWEITHTLKKFPAVTVVDSAGSVVVGDINYIDDSNITISFQAAFAGKAYLN